MQVEVRPMAKNRAEKEVGLAVPAGHAAPEEASRRVRCQSGQWRSMHDKGYAIRWRAAREGDGWRRSGGRRRPAPWGRLHPLHARLQSSVMSWFRGASKSKRKSQTKPSATRAWLYTDRRILVKIWPQCHGKAKTPPP